MEKVSANIYGVEFANLISYFFQYNMIKFDTKDNPSKDVVNQYETLYIQTRIFNTNVRKVLVYGGSTLNISSMDLLNQLDRSKLPPIEN